MKRADFERSFVVDACPSTLHPYTLKAMTCTHVAHVRPKEFAKTLIVKIDGRLAMAVVAATEKLDLAQLKNATTAKHVSLVPEMEFERCFPGCEPGAMPPFGNLYGMEVFVSKTLAADDQIALNAGSHAELIQMAYRDYERLVQPIVAALVSTSGAATNGVRV